MLAFLSTGLIAVSLVVSLGVIGTSLWRLDLKALRTEPEDPVRDIEYRLRGIGPAPLKTTVVRRLRPDTARWAGGACQAGGVSPEASARRRWRFTRA